MAELEKLKFKIYREVEVDCVDRRKRKGFIYTKDPLTNSIVLVRCSKLCERKTLASTGPQDAVITSDSYTGLHLENEFGRDNITRCEGMVCKHSSLQFEIIMGDAYTSIKDIDGCKDPDTLIYLEEKIKQTFERSDLGGEADSTEMNSKLENFIQYIKSHHLPFKLDNMSVVLFEGVARIDPPYSVKSCQSRNPIVLDKIQKLVANFDKY